MDKPRPPGNDRRDMGRSSVTEVWERPDYWMIFTAPSQFMTLPVQDLTPADRTFLRSKMPPAVTGLAGGETA
ncbi:YcxB family protein [Hyphomicrobium sp.]|uniref:YcxB family protein n=1 Tax=Hyphomicrobium sp. TaxID=82 RepID=UPI003FA532E2